MEQRKIDFIKSVVKLWVRQFQNSVLLISFYITYFIYFPSFLFYISKQFFVHHVKGRIQGLRH